MTPSYFQRGMPITADQLNSLVDWVKRNTLTAGVGYTLSQSPGGTSLSLRQENAGGSAGSSAATLCTWRVEDISEMINGRLHLKLRVFCDAVQPSGRYPTDTSKQTPYKDIDLGENRDEGWTGVYVEIKVDQKNGILAGDAGINIHEVNGWVTENSVRQVTYIAGVTISNDELGHPYISYIDNYCPNVVVKAAPTCAFLIEDNTVPFSPNLQILIRSTAIERHYPTGMDDTNTYTLSVPDTQQWFAMYCVIVTDNQGNIQFGENDITLSIEAEYKQSTSTLTYFLLGEVNTGYDENSQRIIDYIYNVCAIPSVSGAVDPFTGIVIPRGVSQSCPFKCTDASENGVIKIEVAQNTVNVNTGARWPQGMGVGNPPYRITITETSYFYVKLVYVSNDVIVKPDEDAITIANETTLMENTVDEEYILIAIVEVEDDKVKSITNQCQSVTANPCNLKWGTMPAP
jgi:hypothetical protein